MSVFEKQVYVPADLLQALGEHTGHFWSSPALDPIICDAIRTWMKPAPVVQQLPAASSEAGYQWKQVFLPQGTRLRASFGGQPWFAVVEGARITYDGQSISPSRFANLQGCGNRNAWKTIWLRLPGSDEWLLADLCRSARNSAIVRMFGGDAPPAKSRARAAPRPRQGQDTGKPPASRRAGGNVKANAGTNAKANANANAIKDGGRVAVKVRPAAPASAPVLTKVRPSSTPGAASDNGIERKNGSGPAARRKRRARKHASAAS